MKILAIIPARGGSKGIPLKNLVKLNGKPLIYYTIRSSLKSKLINRIIVSTDNKKIARIASNYGVEIISRPEQLASDVAPLEPVVDHVLQYLKKLEKYVPDIIVILQATSPLRNEKHIDGALNELINKKFHSVLSGFSIHTFLWKYNENGTVHAVDYDPKRRPNRQQLDTQLFENGAIFASTTKAYLKNKCRISGKIGFYVMPLHHSYNVDSYEDLKAIERMMRTRKNT